MSFKCNKCKGEVSNSKMAGLVFGQIAKNVLDMKGITGKALLVSALDKGDFSAGTLSGLGIKCPACEAANWS